jgi:hypothetical protein
MLDEPRADLIEAAGDDWVYFAEILSMVREITGSTDDLLRQAGQAAAQFVREGVIVPGTLTEAKGFTPWPTSAGESAACIEREVAAMLCAGADPLPGDLCWFDLPDRAGTRAAGT